MAGTRPRAIPIILLKWSPLLSFVFLASCAELLTPGAFRYIPMGGYDETPPRDAIVGMWKSTMLLGDEAGNFYDSVFLMADGTGFARARTMTRAEYENVPIKWEYAGEGWWTVEFPNQTHRFRVAKNRDNDGNLTLYLVLSGLQNLRYIRVPE